MQPSVQKLETKVSKGQTLIRNKSSTISDENTLSANARK